MPRIAVFDSGLGSMSVVRELRREGRRWRQQRQQQEGTEIIYYADTASFPYGSKSKRQLRRIIGRTVDVLGRTFEPDAIIMASNTPTVSLGIRDGYRDDGMLVAGVRPPLAEALRLSRTGRVGVLGTASGVRSSGMSRMIKSCTAGPGRLVFPINGSELVGLVESGAFLADEGRCRDAVRRILVPAVSRHGIDTVTLSSTHLPFLSRVLSAECPGVRFVDPARSVAEWVFSQMPGRRPAAPAARRDSLRVYASGDFSAFQRNLAALGVRRTVRPLPHPV